MVSFISLANELTNFFSSSAQTMRGVAVMSAAPGSPGGDIKGTVTFTAEGPGMARVNVQVSGLKAGSGMFVVDSCFFLCKH